MVNLPPQRFLLVLWGLFWYQIQIIQPNFQLIILTSFRVIWKTSYFSIFFFFFYSIVKLKINKWRFFSQYLRVKVMKQHFRYDSQMESRFLRKEKNENHFWTVFLKSVHHQILSESAFYIILLCTQELFQFFWSGGTLWKKLKTIFFFIYNLVFKRTNIILFCW